MQRKPPKGKGKVHAEAKSKADHKTDANPSTEPAPVEANPISEANPSQEPAPVEAEAPRASQVSQVVNPTQNSAHVEANQSSATVATHGLFDEISDEVMATIPEITVEENSNPTQKYRSAQKMEKREK
ncbi:hypothetical protein P8452_09088 [Trifolium repens]|nr:hypothetical protein P8452_09088 [Trifolium repens]